MSPVGPSDCSLGAKGTRIGWTLSLFTLLGKFHPSFIILENGDDDAAAIGIPLGHVSPAQDAFKRACAQVFMLKISHFPTP